MRPAHIHFRVHADGYQELITDVFVAGVSYRSRLRLTPPDAA